MASGVSESQFLVTLLAHSAATNRRHRRVFAGVPWVGVTVQYYTG